MAILQLHERDNVVVVVRDMPPGEVVSVAGRAPITVGQLVPAGHKVALEPIGPGAPIVKYGEPIGVARRPIEPGEWVHSEQMAYVERPVAHWRECSNDSAAAPGLAQGLEELARPWKRVTFDGYRRRDGRVGTRNYIAIVSSVNCSATVSRRIADRFDGRRLMQWPNVDGVVALTHEGGCGMPRSGLQQTMLQRVLRGVMRHPNVAACLCIGLGCEQTQVGELVSLDGTGTPDGERDPARVLVMQQVGGTAKTIDVAESIVESWLPQVNRISREPVELGELVVATECGGSDAFSGITANRVVGAAIDRLVSVGGTGVLSETSEVTGAEQSLLRRAASESVAEKLVERLEWWRWYAGLFGASLDANPSPGNQAGGLTTIAEKSLGAVQKGGTTTLVDVLEYAQQIEARGLVFMDTPGYDPPSVTGMVAGGATAVLFTTGRGSCFGCALAPTIKVSTTSELARRMADDIDFDAGPVLSGKPIGELADALLRKAVSVASGERVASERHGYGGHEFVPWHVGPVL